MPNGNGSNGNGHADVPVDEDLKERIEYAAAKGVDAFWKAVAEIFPEVPTGDVTPIGSMDFTRSSLAAIFEWLDNNHPAPDITKRLKAIHKVI